MHKRFRSYLVWLICLSFLAGTALGGNGGVVCVGEDSTMKLEAVCQPCCTDEIDHCSEEATAADAELHDSCFSCTDIPLVQNSITGRSFRSINIDKLASACLLITPTSTQFTGQIARQKLLGQGTVLQSGPPPSITTTILIC